MKKLDTGFSLLDKKPESLAAKTGFLSLDVAASANILKCAANTVMSVVSLFIFVKAAVLRSFYLLSWLLIVDLKVLLTFCSSFSISWNR